jgi:hypothetical protein
MNKKKTPPFQAVVFEMIDQGIDVFEWLFAMKTVEIDSIDRVLADGDVIPKLVDPFSAKLALSIAAAEETVTHEAIFR